MFWELDIFKYNGSGNCDVIYSMPESFEIRIFRKKIQKNRVSWLVTCIVFYSPFIPFHKYNFWIALICNNVKQNFRQFLENITASKETFFWSDKYQSGIFYELVMNETSMNNYWYHEHCEIFAKRVLQCELTCLWWFWRWKSTYASLM